MRWNRIAMAACVAAAGLLAWMAGGVNAGPQPAGSRPVPVRVAVAAPSDAATSIRVTGTLVYKREMSLAFKVQGIIAGFEVDSGDMVRKGQVLARLDPTEVSARGADAQAQLDLATTQAKRARELYARGFASKARVDDAEAAVSRARAARSAAGFDETRAVIVAPADGIILSRLAEPNQVTPPGAPVLLMGDVASGLVLKVPLADADVTRVREGDKARVTFAGLDTLDASVARIAGKADARTGSFDVELRLASSATGLRSGLVGDARISPSLKGGRATIVAIPALALLEGRGDQAAVFVIDAQGRARRVSVRTQGFLDESVLVAEGLKEGDRVVTSGAPYLRNGQAVSIVKDAPAP